MNTKLLGKQRAQDAINFIQLLKHTKGTWHGTDFALLDWQKEIISDVFGTLKPDGYRKYNTAYIEIPKKNGKALAIDTPIPVLDGWKEMKDVRIGDILFDEYGKQCSVIETTDIMFGHQCYEIAFSDGSKITADADHKWKTLCYKTGRKNGKRFHEDDYLHTTEELYKTLWANRPYDLRNNLICRNHRIKVADSLITDSKELPIHPYVLGIWLGDGKNDSGSFTCGYGDLQIIDEIMNTGLEVHEYKTSNKNSGQFRLGNGDRKQKARNISIQAKLREMNLLDNKHIPGQYLRSSIEQRINLLQGLMDSDGYVSKEGQCEYTTIDYKLAEDAVELIRSLGMKTKITTKTATLNGKECGNKYRIQYWAFSDIPVCKLERKRTRQKAKPNKATRTEYIQIVNILPVESVPVKCIQVDSQSNMYLAGKSMIPTHNSELAAAVALYLLCADGEWAAEVYGCASDRGQASIVFDVAVDMVDQNEYLRKVVKPILSIKRLVFMPKKSFYQVCSAEAYTKHGLNVHGVVFDELHAQPNRELHDVMTKGSGDARMQPLYFEITTAGDDPDRTSIGWEMHQKAYDVIHKTKHIPNFYAKIYGVGENDDWTDERNWIKANPSIGHNLRIDTIRDAFIEAQQSEADERSFRQLRLNQWVKTKSAKWVNLDIWDKNGGIVVPEELEGRKCYGGLDLSSKMDLTAFVLIFPPQDETEKYQVLSYFWIPEDNLKERVKRDYVPYDKWLKQGDIMATPGNAIDYRFIQKTIIDLKDRFDILEIGFDPWNAQQTATELMDAGLEMVEVRQGYKSMSPPMKDMEALLHSHRFNHGGHPILRWNFGNLEVKLDENDNIRPVKGKASDRIDGIVAMINAMARVINAEDPTSVYEERGVISF